MRLLDSNPSWIGGLSLDLLLSCKLLPESRLNLCLFRILNILRLVPSRASRILLSVCVTNEGPTIYLLVVCRVHFFVIFKYVPLLLLSADNILELLLVLLESVSGFGYRNLLIRNFVPVDRIKERVSLYLVRPVLTCT